MKNKTNRPPSDLESLAKQYRGEDVKPRHLRVLVSNAPTPHADDPRVVRQTVNRRATAQVVDTVETEYDDGRVARHERHQGCELTGTNEARRAAGPPKPERPREENWNILGGRRWNLFR